MKSDVTNKISKKREEMSKLDELIKELCPNGVEYKELGEICITVTSPLKLKKSDYKIEGKIPIIDQGEEYIAGYIDFNEYLPKDEYILFGDHSEIIKYVNFEFIQGADGLKILRTKNQIKAKYIYYCFNNFYKKENGYKRHWSNAKRTLIPIPPLEVQDEIVKILDDYTKSVEELKEKLNEELIARRKQYSWYRDYLLKFENKVEIVKLGSVSELKSGGTPKTENLEYWENGIIPWMSSGEVNKGNIYETEKKITKEGYENSNTKMLPKNTVVIALAGQGKTRGTVAITRIELCTNQSLCGIIPNEKLNSDYLYHYLKTQYENLRQLSSGDGTRGGLNLKMIDNYLIPLPLLKVQKRIVEVLDNFEKICNDLNIGLPAEIEARQKQYEFYRNFLLTFKIENCTLPKTRQDKT